jgi:hypothetical protein
LFLFLVKKSKERILKDLDPPAGHGTRSHNFLIKDVDNGQALRAQSSRRNADSIIDKMML